MYLIRVNHCRAMAPAGDVPTVSIMPVCRLVSTSVIGSGMGETPMLAKMTWDPAQDWRAVLDEYYRRGFGPAAPTIKAYWEFLALFPKSRRTTLVRYRLEYLLEHGAGGYAALERFERAKAGLKQAESRFQQAEANYRRMQELYQKKAVSKSALENAQAAYEAAAAQVEQLKSALDLAYAQLKDIAAWGAAWLTLEAINALTSGEEDTRAARWKKTYEDRMSAIVRDGGDLLYDAVRDTSDDLTNTAPVVADPTPIEGRMTFGQLTRKRHKRNAWTTRYWPG